MLQGSNSTATFVCISDFPRRGSHSKRERSGLNNEINGLCYPNFSPLLQLDMINMDSLYEGDQMKICDNTSNVLINVTVWNVSLSIVAVEEL